MHSIVIILIGFPPTFLPWHLMQLSHVVVLFYLVFLCWFHAFLFIVKFLSVVSYPVNDRRISDMAQNKLAKHVLITGTPGVGKTTLIKKVVAILKKDNQINIDGFYTEELRQDGTRKGFDVIQLTSSHRAPLARKSDDCFQGKTGMPMVGQYYVDVKSFESIALQSLDIMETMKQILVVDEIGKMELFSNAFIQKIKQIFQHENVIILATVPMFKGKPIKLVEELKARADCQLLTVTKGNRGSLVDDVVSSLKAAFQSV